MIDLRKNKNYVEERKIIFSENFGDDGRVDATTLHYDSDSDDGDEWLVISNNFGTAVYEVIDPKDIDNLIIALTEAKKWFIPTFTAKKTTKKAGAK